MHRKCESSHINSDTTKILSDIFNGLFWGSCERNAEYQDTKRLITGALKNLNIYSLLRSTDNVRIFRDK